MTHVETVRQQRQRLAELEGIRDRPLTEAEIAEVINLDRAERKRLSVRKWRANHAEQETARVAAWRQKNAQAQA